jgi:hypothetical protein
VAFAGGEALQIEGNKNVESARLEGCDTDWDVRSEKAAVTRVQTMQAYGVLVLRLRARM